MMNHNADLLADLNMGLDTDLDTDSIQNANMYEYRNYAECTFCTAGLEFMICHEKLYADKSKTKLINGKVFHKVEWTRNATTINPKTEISNNIYSNITN